MSEHHILILLSIGYVLLVIDKKKNIIPIPLLLVLIGMGLSFIPFFAEIQVTKTLIYDWLLPALLFVSAYRISFSALKKYGLLICLLSTIGLMLTALLLGSAIWFLGPVLSMSFISALVIASILTPTDPVSVVSVLKESDVNPMLVTVIEGESMVNDGTSIVVFTIVSNLLMSEKSFSFLYFSKEFLLVSLGGAGIGMIVGWLLAKSIYVTHQKEYQIMLSIVMSYGSFHIAEQIGVSGVLATVISGIMLSYECERSEKEAHFRENLEGFWAVLDTSISSLVFLIIGIVAMRHIDWNQWLLMLTIFLISLLVRYLILTLLAGPVKKWRRDLRWQGFVILTLADVRGTMSVILLLTLSIDLPQELNYILSLSFGVVLLSLVLQSIMIYPLSRLAENIKNKG